jgi:hypothetical protein
VLKIVLLKMARGWVGSGSVKKAYGSGTLLLSKEETDLSNEKAVRIRNNAC